MKLDVDQTAGIDFVLQLGAVSQTVEVRGGAPLLQTQTASVGQQINNRTIVTLPLNGRDYTQLVTLGAGAAPNHYSRASNGFSLNGGVTFQTTLMLDGTDNTNYEIGTDSGNIDALSPSVDAVQEFKVETGDYGAQYGRSAGGVVSVTIKSGGNQFHGDAFEFLPNHALDANDFFANSAGLPRPPLRRNQFGGTLGGPVIRNHSFFFVSYQGTRQESSQTGATTVPTPAMIQGDFAGSKLIYNPFNVVNGIRQEFPGNTIPAGLMDPVGKKLAALYPSPNLAGFVNNYAFSRSETDNADEFDSRFDEQFSARDVASVTFSRGTAESNFGSFFAPPGSGGSGGTLNSFPTHIPIDAYLVAAGETHIFSSAVVNELHAGYTHMQSNQLVPATQSLFQEFGLKGIPLAAELPGLPEMTLTGFSSLGDRNWAPNLKLVQESQINDMVSWVKGNHTVKFGGEFIDTHNLADSWNMPRTHIGFNGQFTSQVPGKGSGSAFADMLLGQTSSAGLGTVQLERLRNHYYGLFINDSWKVTPKLTANLGLRYDLQTPWWDRDNHMTNFDFNAGSRGFGTLVPARGGSTLARTFANLDTNNLAPRLGLAYQLAHGTVLRAGFGIF